MPAHSIPNVHSCKPQECMLILEAHISAGGQASWIENIRTCGQRPMPAPLPYQLEQQIWKYNSLNGLPVDPTYVQPLPLPAAHAQPARKHCAGKRESA
eukprot:364253-Chlamydomonas_euryale.AAC.20